MISPGPASTACGSSCWHQNSCGRRGVLDETSGMPLVAPLASGIYAQLHSDSVLDMLLVGRRVEENSWLPPGPLGPNSFDQISNPRSGSGSGSIALRRSFTLFLRRGQAHRNETPFTACFDSFRWSLLGTWGIHCFAMIWTNYLYLFVVYYFT